ncbi:hypothetical protein B005_2093 [Nocardiopsis alba ATCC BAA-2165]|uniref:Uncharacterized protein n=1 Tax=Nocardiopsis alba (strain ATCC BAA-2165 / BE74) TaxID=1205910 RepID=J7LAN0_NOCAA|nr:hypothetical protein B005_2093 [Nocardiopsis alba ATCC BAA-2165]
MPERLYVLLPGEIVGHLDRESPDQAPSFLPNVSSRALVRAARTSM